MGANYLQIPVNCPFKVRNYQRDGPQNISDNHCGAPNYFPNSFSGPNHNAVHLETNIQITGDAKRYDSGDEDNYSQCGIFWRNTLNDEGRANLIENISGHLIDAAPFLQERAINMFTKCDADYGKRLREALNKLKNLKSSVIYLYFIFKLKLNNFIKYIFFNLIR